MVPILYIVIPCYNEETVLPQTLPLFIGKLNELINDNKVSSQSRVLCVDDGSKDTTWNIISEFADKNDNKIIGIKESHNNGHQNAVVAGMLEAKDKCNIVITIDCDGQDDINAMNEMVKEYSENGCDVVYGVRSNRDSDSFGKKWSAQLYYKLLNKMGVNAVYNHADYRLVSNKVLRAFSDYKEVNLFLRGLFPLIGFKSTSVYYERHERVAGKSHYPLAKMLNLAMDGITSFSVKPLNFVLGLGFIVAFISFIGCIWSVISYFTGHTVAGWTSMTCIICLISGVQLICLGVIGLYIGKIYMEVKHRPRYIIEDKTKNIC